MLKGDAASFEPLVEKYSPRTFAIGAARAVLTPVGRIKRRK